MKRIVLIASLFLFVAGCSKTEEEPQPVTFTVGFQMPEGGSMSRSVDDLYQKFYDEQIKTKQLTYPQYSLEFYQNDVLIAGFAGEWDMDYITLPTGTYTVKGYSGDYRPIDDHTDFTSDRYAKTSLKFEETVVIGENTKKITLNAKYDCYMIFFDSSMFDYVDAYKKVKYSSNTDPDWKSIPFCSASGLHYIFVTPSIAIDAIGFCNTSINGHYYIEDFAFENGKYYGFDTINGSFEIPPMESGL